QFVRELLTHGAGPVWGRAGGAGLAFADDVSPQEFYLAKEMKPENLAAVTARLFLGVRLECAQCHDHPFGRWSRRQFWSFAAFFAGLARAPERFGPGVMDRVERHRLEIPGNGQVVEAAFLDGTAPAWRANVSPRVKLAEWVTAPDHPLFARAAATRVW